MIHSRLFVMSASALVMLSSVALAQTPATPAKGTPVMREEMADLVRQVLMDHPEIIVESAQKYREKQLVDAQKKAKEQLEKRQSDIYNDASAPSAGSENPDVTMAVFFDYHCGYCKKILPSIVKLIGEDKKLKVVFKEFPILSEDSVYASRAAIAVYRIAKEKYFDFHAALMGHDGSFDEKSVMEIAKKLGINTDKLKAEIPKPEVTAELDKTRQLAEDLSVRGTPAIAIGTTLIPGAAEYDDLKKEIENFRKNKKS